jgi:hypothetical protein
MNKNTDENAPFFVHELKREGDAVSITSLCKSMVDYFALNKNVAGSIPAEAPYNSSARSYSLFLKSLP